MKQWLGLSALVTFATAACDGDIQLGGPTADDAGGADATLPDSGLDARVDSSVGSDGVLGSCTDESGCGFDTLHCDLGRSTCVECRDDADCRSGDRIVCETLAGRCVGCRDDRDCNAEKRCDLARHTCVNRCSAARPCSLGTCDVPSERCIECTAGTACSSSRVCASTAVCVGCTSDQHCTGENSRCDVLLGRCVECISNAHCAAPERCDLRSGECSTLEH